MSLLVSDQVELVSLVHVIIQDLVLVQDGLPAQEAFVFHPGGHPIVLRGAVLAVLLFAVADNGVPGRHLLGAIVASKLARVPPRSVIFSGRHLFGLVGLIFLRVVNDYDSDRDSVSDCWRENDRLTGYRRLPAITYYRAARLE